MTAVRAARAEAIIAGVLRQAVRDADAIAIMVIDAGSAEGAWLLELCGRHEVAAHVAPQPSPGLAAQRWFGRRLDVRIMHSEPKSRYALSP